MRTLPPSGLDDPTTRAILLNMVSAMLRHEPCAGVKTNSNLLGCSFSQACVSLEVCPEWSSSRMRIRV